MKKLGDKTEYILLPLSIYLKFFKDVKISGKRISAVLDETEIGRNKKRKKQPETKSEPKIKKAKRESVESPKGVSQRSESFSNDSASSFGSGSSQSSE